jgi:hypothetical protein
VPAGSWINWVTVVVIMVTGLVTRSPTMDVFDGSGGGSANNEIERNNKPRNAQHRSVPLHSAVHPLTDGGLERDMSVTAGRSGTQTLSAAHRRLGFNVDGCAITPPDRIDMTGVRSTAGNDITG